MPRLNLITSILLLIFLSTYLFFLPIIVHSQSFPDCMKMYPAGLDDYKIVAVAISPSAPYAIYALTSEDGIFKSTNCGNTWEQKNIGLPYNPYVGCNYAAHILAITFNPDDPEEKDILYASINGNLYRTTNGADTWENINHGIESIPGVEECTYNNMTGVALDPSIFNHIYAGAITQGCGGGLFESYNGGDTWTMIATICPDTGSCLPGIDLNNDTWHIAVDPLDYAGKRRLYIATAHRPFYRNFNSGISDECNCTGDPSDEYCRWVLANGPFPLPCGQYCPCSGSVIVVYPYDTNRLLFGGADFDRTMSGLYVSTDTGVNWEEKIHTAPGQVWSIRLNKLDSDIGYAGTCQGLFTTEDGGLSWSPVDSTQNIRIRDIAIHPEDPYLVFFGSMWWETTPSFPPFTQGMYRVINTDFSNSTMSFSPDGDIPLGTNLTITANVINSCNRVGQGMVLVVNIPEKVDYIVGSLTVDGVPTPEDWVDGDLIVELGDISEGEEVEVTYQFKVKRCSDEMVHSVIIKSYDDPCMPEFNKNIIIPLNCPFLKSITPSKGLVNERTLVTINGNDFQPGCTVIHPNAGNVTFIDSSEITAQILPGNQIGSHNLVVENPDGQSDTLENAFTVMEPPDFEKLLIINENQDCGENSVALFDTSNKEMIEEISILDPDPVAMIKLVSNDFGTVYGVHETKDTLYIIDSLTQQVVGSYDIDLNFGIYTSIALSHYDERILLLANYLFTQTTLTCIDTSTCNDNSCDSCYDKLRLTIIGNADARELVVSPDDKFIYIAGGKSELLYIVNVSAWDPAEIEAIAIEETPNPGCKVPVVDVQTSLDGKKVFVLTSHGGTNCDCDDTCSVIVLQRNSDDSHTVVDRIKLCPTQGCTEGFNFMEMSQDGSILTITEIDGNRVYFFYTEDHQVKESYTSSDLGVDYIKNTFISYDNSEFYLLRSSTEDTQSNPIPGTTCAGDNPLCSPGNPAYYRGEVRAFNYSPLYDPPGDEDFVNLLGLYSPPLAA